jgi:hypothetical protein
MDISTAPPRPTTRHLSPAYTLCYMARGTAVAGRLTRPERPISGVASSSGLRSEVNGPAPGSGAWAAANGWVMVGQPYFDGCGTRHWLGRILRVAGCVEYGDDARWNQLNARKKRNGGESTRDIGRPCHWVEHYGYWITSKYHGPDSSFRTNGIITHLKLGI